VPKRLEGLAFRGSLLGRLISAGVDIRGRSFFRFLVGGSDDRPRPSRSRDAVSGDPRLRNPHESLAPPHSHDAHPVLVHPIDDAEWRMDDLPELSDTELGNDTPALREVCESLDRRNDLVEESVADLGHLTRAVPRPHPLKVLDG
jgi:hypothetical protein